MAISRASRKNRVLRLRLVWGAIPWSPTMQDYVAHAYIAHFEILLKSETDPGKVIILTNLLALERAKLATPSPKV